MKSIPVLNRRQLERQFLKAGRPTFGQIAEPGHREPMPEKTPPPLWGTVDGQTDVGIG